MVRERKITARQSDAADEELAEEAPDSTAVKPKPADDPSSSGENDSILRPRRIADMVGQRDVMEVLQIAIDAAKKRKEPLGHILLDGPPGLGKTTFAVCIPRELGVKVDMASGPSLKAPKEIIPYLTFPNRSRNSSTRPWKTSASTSSSARESMPGRST
jgi:Holliday junction DNA helicase RuvB